MENGVSNLAAAMDAGPLSTSALLEVALQIAEALSALHQKHHMHCAIHPGNIVWNAQTGRANLYAFDDVPSSTTLIEQPVSRPNRSVQPMAYVSPEQTGRTGHVMDERTDLYSLGVTLYQFATGCLPFEGEDVVELMHAHIARRPRAPHELVATLPLPVSEIILKLLEKEPSLRYQSAGALMADLTEARLQWQANGCIQPFPLAQMDTTREFLVSDQLYGRAPELHQLTMAFEHARHGGRDLVLITGAPGIGKSALVRQLGHDIVEQHCFFIAGKFDQLQRSLPFMAFAQAIQDLVRQLLTLPDARLAEWRERVLHAVSPNGQLLVDVVPELGSVLGPQPAVPEVGPVESRNRFRLVFIHFLSVFARPGAPLTLFLDDLQWADTASLQLLDDWLGDPASHHLLLVGAYRDQEVGPTHLLTASLLAWCTNGIECQTLALAPLTADHVAQLTADVLQQPVDRIQPLAKLLVQKTAGNPFFIRRLLHLLNSKGLIRVEPRSRRWEWDTMQIEREPISDNVQDLMIDSICQLPESTRTLLETSACFGHRFELNALGMIIELTPQELAEQLRPAIADGLLQPVFPTSTDDASVVTMRFVHDRVQQAAYALLNDNRRQVTHLAIGRQLRASTVDGLPDKLLFDTADQFVLGETLVTEPTERLDVADIMLVAGRKAKASAAYQAAYDYLTVGLRLLPDEPWDTQPVLTLALHREMGEAAYLTGRHAHAEELIETALTHTDSKIGRADLYSLRVLAATVEGDWSRALRCGHDGLAVFGLEWPLNDVGNANEAEATAVMVNVGTTPISDLVKVPEVKDEETRSAMRLLSLLGPPAYFSGNEVLTFLLTRAVNLSLLHGPSPYSAYAYVFYGALHNARTGDYGVGHAFGKLALALAQRFGDRAEESRTLEVHALLVHFWKAPLRDALPMLREGVRAGVESGELAYAAFNLCSVLINGLPAGVSLSELAVDAEVSIEFANRHRNRTALEISQPFRQFVYALKGVTQTPGSFEDENFNQASFLEAARDNHTALGNFWVSRLQAAYLFGDHAAARCASQEGNRYILSGILGMMPSAEHVFYTALLKAAEYRRVLVVGQAALLPDTLTKLHDRLQNLAAHCPENFHHKAALLGAEIAALEGRMGEAMALYRQALDGAARQRFVQDEALAHELRARFLLTLHEPELATVHWRAACERYRQWGATAKALELEQELEEAPWRPAVAEVPMAQRRVSIDSLALIKASQAISAETTPERLFERILQVLVEVAGAQNGALVLSNAESAEPPMVRARILSTAEGSVSVDEVPLDKCVDYPKSLLRYVLRTKEALRLANALEAPMFRNDPVVQARKLRSVLCIPLVQQNRQIGVVYLENNELFDAFAEEVVEVVQVLAAQAVISLENTRLLQASRLEVEQRRQAEQALGMADRRKDEFLAMLAHELRNPLAPISAAAEILRLASHDTARVVRTSAVIARQVRHMTGLVDDLLDVSRVTRGLVSLDLRELDMHQSVLEAIEQVRPLIDLRHHELNLHTASGTAMVRADPKRMVQVVTNLLTNAAKYTPEGGSLSVNLGSAEGMVRLIVSDTGQGMTPDLLASCFGLFVQAERSPERAAGGLGIGLALVKSIVELHGGQVSAHSDGPALGSRITVLLPMLPPPDVSLVPSHVLTDADAIQPVPGLLSVLVVDDNVDAAEMLSVLVEALGYHTACEHHPLRALERIEKEPLDVCLLDVGMPEMDGYELATEIRRRLGSRSITLVAITGYGQPQDREKALQAGFDAHFAKPVDTDGLVALLAEQARKK